MDHDELRSRLAVILAEEDGESVDWAIVDAMLDRLTADLKNSDYPHFIGHFMSDSDIRAKDRMYGDHQRRAVRRFVNTGEYLESKEVSPLGCLAVLAALAGLAFWFS